MSQDALRVSVSRGSDASRMTGSDSSRPSRRSSDSYVVGNLCRDTFQLRDEVVFIADVHEDRSEIFEVERYGIFFSNDVDCRIVGLPTIGRMASS